MTQINGWGCFFLVALRLVIGWHFLVEGVHKIHTHYLGKTSTNTPWTGEGFFKEAYGPLADRYRHWLQVDNGEQLSRLRSTGPLPEALAAEWDNALAKFTGHYELTAEQQRAAEDKLNEAKRETADWLSGKTTTIVSKAMNWGPVDLRLGVPARLAEYDAKAREIAEATEDRLPAFNRDVDKSRLRSLKADANKILAELNTELDARTSALTASWTGLLTDGQRTKGPPAVEQRTRRIDWLDRVTMWSHAILGGCLLIGLFTRTACLFLALFLVQIQLLAPALPFAPAAPGSVGYYLFVNLYTIELVALLALVAIPTGRWFGVDALVFAVRRRPSGDRFAAKPAATRRLKIRKD